MPLRRHLNLLGIFITLVSVHVGSWLLASQPDTKTVRALFSQEEPLLDGDLSDSVWREAEVISDFRQIVPVEGGVPSEKTEVRVLYTEDALFISFTCFDSEPDRILGSQRRRDFRTSIGSADDAVNFVLDPNHERRDGYQFKVNPLGTQTDQLINDTYRRTMQWDAAWESAARIHSWGWAAEIRIPFKMLQIRARDEPVWGIDFKRTIGRKNEDMGWNNYIIDNDFYNLLYPGHLLGISSTVSGGSVKIKTYAAAGFRGPRAVKRPPGRAISTWASRTFTIPSPRLWT